MDKDCHRHPSHKQDLPRLNRISGQIEGIRRMIEANRYCGDILIQLRAARAALRNIELQIFDRHLSTCVTDAFLGEDLEAKKQKVEEIRELIKRFD